jgi:hypothetical protein
VEPTHLSGRQVPKCRLCFDELATIELQTLAVNTGDSSESIKLIASLILCSFPRLRGGLVVTNLGKRIAQ